MPTRFTSILILLMLLAALAHAGVHSTGSPTSTNNDDSCDIALLPAATLLLPYFEVDIEGPPGSGETTLFSVTNTANLPQIARVTLWTDWAYPVIAFNIYLTGYDVQSISLYDVIKDGRLVPPDGTGSDISPVGELSGTSGTAEFDNPLVSEETCVTQPVQIPQSIIDRIQSAFTIGKATAFGTSLPACEKIGGVHEHAIGYATIDVVRVCSTTFPTDAEYFSSEILFDNVLMGDYLQVNGAENFAQGSPMVHIRAIPEGGSVASRAADPAVRVNVPRTFYSRFQPAGNPTRDARQPLPSLFAARWISGGAGAFQTHFKIWREGRGSSTSPCSAYLADARLGMIEMVRFDEDENPVTWVPPIIICTPVPFYPILPPTSATRSDDTEVYPPQLSEVAGWMYMNLDYCDRDDFASQNWAVVSMRAEGRFSTDFDVLALGNGCTPPIPPSEAYRTPGIPIGPAPNVNP